jgi:WD40 repeat protein
MKKVVHLILVFFYLGVSAQQIEVAVQKGHSGDILVMAFNHDGNLLASAGADNLIKLWHIPTGKEMASFVSARTLPIQAINFKGDNDQLNVRYSDGIVHTWDIASSSLQSTQTNSNAVTDSRFEYESKDASFIIGIDRFYMRKKNKQTGNVLFSKVPIDISRNFNAVAVSEANNLIIAANEDGKVYAYDLTKGKSIAILDGHYSSVNSVCFSPNEKIFATGGADRSIIIWNSADRKPLKRLFGRSFRYESVVFNHSGTQLAIGDELGNGRIIHLQSSRVNVAVYPWHQQKISSLAFSANDSIVYSGGFDNRLVAFNLHKEKIVNKGIYKNYVSSGDFVLKKLHAYRDPYAWINAIAVSPHGTKIGYGGGWRESEIRKQPQPLRIEDLSADTQYKLASHQGSLNDILFFDEVTVLTAGPDGLVQWVLDESSHSFYFRKKKVPDVTEISKIIRGPSNTVMLQTGNKLLLYDLKTETLLDSIHAPGPISSVAYDPTTNRIVYAVFSRLVFTNTNLWHTNEVSIDQAHSDKITSISFNPTSPTVATASWDATVKLWNAENGDLKATLVSMGADDHLIITPDHYYYGTKNSLRGLGFKYGKEFISPEQYDLRFNRPDIVLARLGFVPKEVVRSFQRAYQKRLQRLNFTEQMLSEEIHLPVVSLQNSELPLTTSNAHLSFAVHANDSKFNLDRLNVFVNNIPVYGLKGIDVRDKRVQEITQPVDVDLSAGKNKIQISCLNEKGVESLLQTFEIDYVPEHKTRDNLYVIVVSLSKYDNSAMNLKYARKDGQDIANTFRKLGWFNKVIVDSLYDANATKENILKIRDKLNQTKVDDHVIFYVSGHGLLDQNLDFYFATYDIDFKDPAKRGLRYDDLEGLLDGIPARKKLLMMDACHSGEVDKSRLKISQSSTLLSKNQKGSITEYTYPIDVQEEHFKVGITTSFELMQELFSNLSKGSGAVVISAAAGNSFALESDEWHNGVFTYALLHGLKNHSADKNRNGDITVTELKDFVSKEVERLTNGAQKPTSRRENLEFDFRVY